MGISTNSGCGGTMYSDMVLGDSLGVDVIVILVGTVDPLNQRGPSSGLALKCQHVPWWQPRPQASAQLSVVIGVINIDTDPGYGRAMDPDMAHSSRLGPDDTMVLGGSMGHAGLYGALSS